MRTLISSIDGLFDGTFCPQKKKPKYRKTTPMMITIKSSDIIFISLLTVYQATVVANLNRNAAHSPIKYNHNLSTVEKTFQHVTSAQPDGVVNISESSTKLGRFYREGSHSKHVELSIESDSTFHNDRKPTKLTDSERHNDKISIEPSNSGNSELQINSDTNATITSEEISKYENIEFDDKSSGSILGKINTVDSTNTLPIFLTEPENVYVIKNRPAVLKCKAAHALQLHFKCSGSSQPPPSTHDKHVDPHTGVHVEEITATIHRDLVDEYFGKGPFKCECHAWSSRGAVKSQAATINIAYIRKYFTTSPTSLKVEIGTRAELHCVPPGGYPEPKIVWHKNNMPISNDYNSIVSDDGTITFAHVTLQDMANYTCSAENIAGKRTSDSAVLIVYVNGGWSAWSTWRECKCLGKQSLGRKRFRYCNNPIPMNGGSLCSGPQVQKSADCITCPEETQIVNADSYDVLSSKKRRWSGWSEWSSCSTDCIQVRRRKCIPYGLSEDSMIENDNDILGSGNIAVNANSNSNGIISLGYGKPQCSGKDIQTAECRGEHCFLGKDGFDWTLYLGLAFVVTVCIAFGAALIYCARRNLSLNTHYNMTRTTMNTEYTQGINKKDMNIHIESANVNYDYPSSDHRFLSNDRILGCGIPEHHYDVPNLSANYTNPIDELSVEYVTDTPDTSTADTSNSAYDVTVNASNSTTSKYIVTELISSNGGNLSLYKSEILLYVPEFAIGKSQKKHFSLMLLSDDTTRISIPCAEPLLVCSAIIHCGPRNYIFQKPVILKVPHCLVDPHQWNVNIYHADNDHNDISPMWRKIISVGEETINTPVFVHLDEDHIYIMTEQLGRFAVVANPKAAIIELASIKMRLIAFSQVAPSSPNCSLRIYVVKDFPNSKDICTAIETKLGGTILGESEPFSFRLNDCDLIIRVRNTEESASELDEQTEYEQIIPYNHILNNNSIMHCEFSIKRIQHFNKSFKLQVDFEQCGATVEIENELYSFVISNQRNITSDPQISSSQQQQQQQQQAIVSIDRQCNYLNETNSLSNAYLSRTAKRQICTALDPPRLDERDWRLLAKKLGTDHYIAYFATKPSPTEQILNLWECRAINTSRTIVDLLLVLSDMGRDDIKQIITETIGPLWV